MREPIPCTKRAFKRALARAVFVFARINFTLLAGRVARKRKPNLSVCCVFMAVDRKPGTQSLTTGVPSAKGGSLRLSMEEQERQWSLRKPEILRFLPIAALVEIVYEYDAPLSLRLFRYRRTLTAPSCEAIRHLRIVRDIRTLSSNERPQLVELVQSGLCPTIVRLLGSEHSQLAYEASWIVTNIASGSSRECNLLVQLGVLPLLRRLVMSTDRNVRTQAIWAVGNLAGDSSRLRDRVLQDGFMEPIMRAMQAGDTHLSEMRTACWVMSNLCRGRPPPQLSQILPALPLLVRALDFRDPEVVSDACWALCYATTDERSTRIAAFLRHGGRHALTKLVALISKSHCARVPALRTLGNIVTGDDQQTQLVMSTPGCLATLAKLLSTESVALRKEAAWTLSNMAAGTASQARAVAKAALPSLVALARGADQKVAKEALWTLSNATTHQNGPLHEQIAQRDCLVTLFRGAVDTRFAVSTNAVALEGLVNLRKSTSRVAAETTCAVIREQGPGLLGHLLKKGIRQNQAQNLRELLASVRV